MRFFAALALTVVLAGCGHHAHHHRADPACLLPAQKPMTVVELYFGRDIGGRPGEGGGGRSVSDVDWAGFAARVLAREFADGFTVFDAEGGWRDPASGNPVRERTKVARVALPAGADAALKVRAVIEAYTAEFKQQSVGVLSARMCGAF